MPACRNCGSYTKYNNGLCYSCYSKSNKRAGKVYLGEVTFPNGQKKIYTGQTKRSVYTRVGEHIDNVKTHNTKHYTGRASSFKLLGSVFSTNRFKAEKTIKALPADQKRGLARRGASNVKKKWFKLW